MSSEKIMVGSKYEADFKYTKRRAIKAAKELHYDDAVITRLKAAKTESELTRIMRTARQNKR